MFILRELKARSYAFYRNDILCIYFARVTQHPLGTHGRVIRHVAEDSEIKSTFIRQIVYLGKDLVGYEEGII